MAGSLTQSIKTSRSFRPLSLLGSLHRPAFLWCTASNASLQLPFTLSSAEGRLVAPGVMRGAARMSPAHPPFGMAPDPMR